MISKEDNDGKKRKKKHHSSHHGSEDDVIIEWNRPENEEINFIQRKKKWISMSNSLLRREQNNNLSTIHFFDLASRKFSKFRRKRFFIHWKNMMRWKQIVRDARYFNMQNEISEYQSNWHKIILLLTENQRKFNFVSSFHDYMFQKRLPNFFFQWSTRSKSIRNWENFAISLIQRNHQESLTKAQIFSHLLANWMEMKSSSLIAVNRTKFELARRKYDRALIIQSMAVRLLRKHYSEQLKAGQRMIEKGYSLTLLVIKELKYQEIESCKRAKKKLDTSRKIIEWKQKLVHSEIIRNLKHTKDNFDTETRRELLSTMINKWYEKMKIKVYSRRFIKAHFKGIIRDYSLHVQNEAAKTIQKWWISVLNKQKSNELLLQRVILHWRNVSGKLAESFIVAPDMNLKVTPPISFDVSEFSDVFVPQLDVFRDIIDFAYDKNMMLAEQVGNEVGDMLEEIIFVPKLPFSAALALDNLYVGVEIPKDEPIYTLDLDFIELVSSNSSNTTNHLVSYDHHKEIPINENIINKATKQTTLSRRLKPFKPTVTIKPLNVISLTKLEKDIKCTTFDEDDILIPTFLDNEFIELSQETACCVKPLDKFIPGHLFKFTRGSFRSLEAAFDLSIQSVVRKNFIPKFDIIEIDYGYLKNSQGFGFDRFEFANSFDNCIRELCSFVVPNSLPKIPQFTVEPAVNVDSFVEEIKQDALGVVGSIINDPLPSLDMYIEQDEIEESTLSDVDFVFSSDESEPNTTILDPDEVFGEVDKPDVKKVNILDLEIASNYKISAEEPDSPTTTSSTVTTTISSSMSMFDFIFDEREVVESIDLSLSSLMIKLNEENVMKNIDAFEEGIKDINEDDVSESIEQLSRDYSSQSTGSSQYSHISIPSSLLNGSDKSYQTAPSVETQPTIDENTNESQNTILDSMQISGDFSEIQGGLVIENQEPETRPRIDDDLSIVTTANIPKPPITYQVKIDRAESPLPLPETDANVPSIIIPAPPIKANDDQSDEYHTQVQTGTTIDDSFITATVDDDQSRKEEKQDDSQKPSRSSIKSSPKRVSIIKAAPENKSQSSLKSGNTPSEIQDQNTTEVNVQISAATIIPKASVTSVSDIMKKTGTEIFEEEEEDYKPIEEKHHPIEEEEEEDYYEYDENDDSFDVLNNDDLDNLISDVVFQAFNRQFFIFKVDDEFVDEIFGNKLEDCLNDAIGNMFGMFNTQTNEQRTVMPKAAVKINENDNGSVAHERSIERWSHTEIDPDEMDLDSESKVIGDPYSTPETSDGEFIFEKEEGRLDIQEFNNMFASILDGAANDAINDISNRFDMK